MWNMVHGNASRPTSLELCLPARSLSRYTKYVRLELARCLKYAIYSIKITILPETVTNGVICWPRADSLDPDCCHVRSIVSDHMYMGRTTPPRGIVCLDVYRL